MDIHCSFLIPWNQLFISLILVAFLQKFDVFIYSFKIQVYTFTIENFLASQTASLKQQEISNSGKTPQFVRSRTELARRPSVKSNALVDRSISLCGMDIRMINYLNYRFRLEFWCITGEPNWTSITLSQYFYAWRIGGCQNCKQDCKNRDLKSLLSRFCLAVEETDITFTATFWCQEEWHWFSWNMEAFVLWLLVCTGKFMFIFIYLNTFLICWQRKELNTTRLDQAHIIRTINDNMNFLNISRK